MIQPDPKPRRRAEQPRHLYRRLAAAVNDVLRWRYPYVLPLKNHRTPISFLRGTTQADRRPGTLLIAGDENRINYLICRFFQGEYRRERICTASLWNLNRTLKRLRTSADLTIVCVDRTSDRLFFDAEYLAVPEWVGSSLALPENVADLAHKNYKLKRELQRVFRSNLSHELSQTEEDFERFYYTMHAPFTQKRYEGQGVIHNFYQMRRVFRQGGLLWVKRNDQPVAGLLFQRRSQQLRSVAFGTINGEWLPVEAGAFATLYFFLVKHAKEIGCKLVDLGGSRPSLSDGVLRYKRKWGANLTEHYNNHYNFLLHWNRFNERVTSFFSNTPLIFRDNGGLSAMYVIDRGEPVTETEAEKIHRSMWMPGLHKLYLVSTSGWQPGITSPPQTHLVDATTIVESRDLHTSG